jgi:hypothetical protein
MDLGEISKQDVALDWAIKHRIEDLTVMTRACWDMYIKFYTVVMTFNIGAMVLIGGFGKQLANPGPTPRGLAILFAFQDLITTAFSLYMIKYSNEVSRNYLTLEKELLGEATLPDGTSNTPPVPIKLMKMGGLGNALAMAGMVGAWTCVAIGVWKI